MIRKILRHEQGDTLAEVVVSMFILALLGLSLLPLLTSVAVSGSGVGSHDRSTRALELGVNAVQDASSRASMQDADLGGTGEYTVRCSIFTTELSRSVADQKPDTVLRIDLKPNRSQLDKPERTLWFNPSTGTTSGDYSQLCTDMNSMLQLTEVPFRAQVTTCTRAGQTVSQCTTAGGRTRTEVTTIVKE